MDPYLESDLSLGFQHELAVEVKRQLIPLLQPDYYPFTEKYFLLDSEGITIAEERINPDVSIVKGKGEGTVPRRSKGGQAPVVMAVPMPLKRPHYRVAIRDVDKRRLVTAIEFLSPINKRGDGRRQYLEKRDKLLVSTVHLVEIDLLRKGTRLPIIGTLPEGCYFAFVSRSDERPKIRVWPIALDERLPSALPIPLRKRREEVRLDLQRAVQAVYDLGAYESIIDYQNPPKAALTEEDDEWADRLLRSKGLRT